MHCWPTKRIELAQLHLGLADGAAPLRGRLAQLQAGEVAHRAAQLELHLDVGDAVAQRLEAGDRHAELLARVHVVDGDRHQPLHQAHAFGAQRGDADVDRGSSASWPSGDQRGRRLGQRQVGGARAVLGG
jgi:hypothetical protein